MLRLSQYSLVASVMLVALALGCYIVVLLAARSVQPVPVPAGSGARTATGDGGSRGLAFYGTSFAQLALLFLTSSLVARAVQTGHGPFANQYEFSVAFGWGMVAAYVWFEHKYHVRTLALLVLPIAAALLLYAMTVGAFAIVAYGAFSVGCAAGALYLVQPEGGRRGLPRPELLDEISYRSVVIGFPLLTMVIILGAVWAEVAWGTYWSWDPKETASLVTWLVYGAYLHARVARGWRGRRAAWLIMVGFAAVLFTFFGNLFFGGLHSYSGVGPQQ
jgi:ABC-type transport system involved in cytochrome c biogenesis permease subunit